MITTSGRNDCIQISHPPLSLCQLSQGRQHTSLKSSAAELVQLAERAQILPKVCSITGPEPWKCVSKSPQNHSATLSLWDKGSLAVLFIFAPLLHICAFLCPKPLYPVVFSPLYEADKRNGKPSCHRHNVQVSKSWKASK